ncbi:MAG TPA: DUF6034 family protein [Feifaniaceae bacterium]|nr:DUF6034 family protein [Feifaniaceae bacterium]
MKHTIRTLALVLACALALSLCACGRTGKPKNASPQPQVERLALEQPQSETVQNGGYDLPDGSYVWEQTRENGYLRIYVNAEVTAPAALLATLGVTANGFTQAQITGLFNSLFAGQNVTAAVGDNVQTKDEIKAQLDRMKQALEDGTYAEDGFSREEYEKAIQEQEEAYRNAPVSNTSEQAVSDGTMQQVDQGNGAFFALDAKSEPGSQFSVRSYPAGHASELQSTCTYARSYAPEYGMANAVLYQEGEALPQQAQGKLTVSYSDAKALADGLLEAAGLDTELLAAYVVDDAQTGETDGIVHGAEQSAFTFLYERVVSGVPVAADVWEDNTAESRPWNYEQLDVTVDDEGIAAFYWREPLSLTGETGQAGTLLTFPQAKEIFETIAPIAYGAQTSSANPSLDRVEIDLNVTSVQLSLLRVWAGEGAEKTGSLVPAWVFYGDVVDQVFWKDGTSYDAYYRQGMNGAGGSAFRKGPTIVFAVNALDGSVIDPSVGY